jgi:hypothetical protein
VALKIQARARRTRRHRQKPQPTPLPELDTDRWTILFNAGAAHLGLWRRRKPVERGADGPRQARCARAVPALSLATAAVAAAAAPAAPHHPHFPTVTPPRTRPQAGRARAVRGAGLAGGRVRAARPAADAYAHQLLGRVRRRQAVRPVRRCMGQRARKNRPQPSR